MDDELVKRRQYLSRIAEETRKQLKKAPAGTLRISCSSNRVQYYHRKKASDKKGKYIKKDNTKLIKGLAQKSYDEKLLRAIHQEIKAIDKFHNGMPDCRPEELYESLSKYRRKLVLPAIETDAMFRERWENTEYCGNPYICTNAELVSEKGERVRSKSELIIANMLEKAGISYKYECPLYLEGAGTVYPDFTVLNLRLRKEFYWEHMGMMDDADYSEKAVMKIAAYYVNGIYPGKNLILTFETRSISLNIRQIREIIDYYFR